MDRFSARDYPSVSKRIGLVRVTRLLASPRSFPFDAISLSLRSTFLGHLIYTDRITFFFFLRETHNVIYSNDCGVYIYIYMQSSCNKLSSLFVQRCWLLVVVDSQYLYTSLYSWIRQSGVKFKSHFMVSTLSTLWRNAKWSSVCALVANVLAKRESTS